MTCTSKTRQRQNRFPSLACLIALLLGILVASGCENTLEPFSEEATYSIYGYLSLSRDQQFVRIKPLQAPLDSSRTFRSLEVTVTLENLTKGTSETLQDSVVVFRDANTSVATHNYWTAAPIEPETQYRLTIEDTTGTTTRAVTTTPSPVKAQPTPEEGGCKTSFRIDFVGIEETRRIISVEVILQASATNMSFEVADDDLYNADHGRTDHSFTTLRPRVYLSNRWGYDADDPDTPCLEETLCSRLASDEVTIRYTYAGEDWYGSLPEILTSPISSPTVLNGSGYFGGIATGETTVTVDTSAIQSEDPRCQ